MPPYQAQRQSLYGVGTPNYVRPQIDVGGAIDALSSAGNSFIHQAFLRRQAENELQLRRNEFGLQQQRETREAAAQQAELGFKGQQLDIARQDSATRRAMAGYHDPTVTQAAPDVTTTPPAAPNEAAMISGLPSQQGTTPLTRPANLGSLTGPLTKLEFTPGGYDVRNSLRGALLGMRGQQVDEQIDRRAAAQRQGREYMGNLRKSLEKMREDFRTSSGGKAMTGGQKESMLQKAATGLIGQYNGSYDDASDALANTDEGKQLKALGVEPRHLMFAAEQFRSSATKEAVGLQRGAAGQSPEESTANVGKTRTLVGGSKKPKAPRYTPQQIESFYQDALKKGADPAKAKARRDSLLKAGP